MRESSRKGSPPAPVSAAVLTAIFLLISLFLILFFVRPVVPVSRGFGVGPTPTLAAPLPPTQ
jgi:hypothetical protein